MELKTIWESVASYMNDDVRETVHAELAPCTEVVFLRRYLELDPDFIALLDELDINDFNY